MRYFEQKKQTNSEKIKHRTDDTNIYSMTVKLISPVLHTRIHATST